MNLPGIILVTGTDTGVGKTITTAPLAAVLHGTGRSVAVYKPCQSGAAASDSDETEIVRLAGRDGANGSRLAAAHGARRRCRPRRNAAPHGGCARRSGSHHRNSPATSVTGRRLRRSSEQPPHRGADTAGLAAPMVIAATTAPLCAV
jgi:hypothetical protein